MRENEALSVRTQILLWTAQRLSAMVLAACVLVHIVTIIYAVRNGLTAAEILGRTRGSIGWATFYVVFVIAISIHAPIGLRNVLAETFDWRGRSLTHAVHLISFVLLVAGLRAVYAVIA